MTKYDWRRALPRLSLWCVLLAACGDDGASGGDTAATDDGGSVDVTSATGMATGTSAPDPTGTSSPDEASTSSGSDPDDTTTTATAGTDDAGSDGSTGEGAGSSTGGAALEIVGEWLEVFPGGAGMQTHTITEETWLMASDFGDSLHHIESWDADARTLVAQSDAANAFNPELWGKFEWQFADGTLYYCQSVYDAETPDDAWSAPGAEPGDLDTGCGGFPWSELQPQ